MSSGGPKTVEEAMALPELASIFEDRIWLVGPGIEGDHIVAFVDRDGCNKTVHCIRRSKDGPDEWVKVRL